MTRIADPQPPYCASCFQKPEGRCVDFEAAYDGPVVPGTPEPVPVDDLILCENCLEEAFSVIDPQGLHKTIEQLIGLVNALEEEAAAKDKAIQGFRASTNELIDHPVASFPGKPKLEGLPPEISKKITQNRFTRRGTSAAPKEHWKTREKRERAEKEEAMA